MGNWVNRTARLALGLCAGAMLAWLLVLGPLQYASQTSPTAPVLPQLGFLVLLPLVVAVVSTVSLATAYASSKSEPAWTSRLIYPRRFWLWLCGGFTVSDLLVVACWATANACWFAAIFSHRSSRLLAKHAHGAAAGPPPAAVIKMLAKCLGGLLFPNLALLFMPVARGSPLLQAAHMSYPQAIRYHRWLGRFVVLLVLTHGLSYMGVWAIAEGTWARKTFEQAPDNNHAAGFVGLLAAAVLLLSSLEPVRRRHWAVFKALHHAGFWTFLVAGCCHEWRICWYFLPGLTLYAIDGVLRLHQALAPPGQPLSAGAATDSDSAKARSRGSNLSRREQQSQPRVLSASVSSDASVTCLVLEAPQSAACPSGFVWLCIPELSSVQFHPFDFLAVPLAAAASPATDVESAAPVPAAATAAAAAPALLLHIKAYNRWTRRLRDMVKAGQTFTVKIQGPFSEHPWPAPGCGTAALAAGLQQLPDGAGAAASRPLAGVPGCVAIVAGGLGITSAFSALQELAAAAAAAAPTVPHPLAGLPVLLVWSSRSASELELLAPRLLALARALKVDLTTKLYLTAGGAASSNSSRTDSRPLAAEPLHVAGGAGPDGSGGCDMQMSSMCPVLALGSCVGRQAGFRVLAQILAFAGVIAAIFLVRSVADVAGEQPWPVAYTGAAFVLTTAAFILIPGLALLWAALWWQRRSRAAERSSNNPVAAAAAAVAAVVATGSTAELQPSATAPAAGGAVLQLRLPEGLDGAAGGLKAGSSMLPVHSGRPPLTQLLASWLEGVQECSGLQQAALVGKDVAIELAAIRGTSNGSGSSRDSSSSGSSKGVLRCRAYCMGPEIMLQQVQLLCDDMNRGSSRQWWRRVGAAAGSTHDEGLPTTLQNNQPRSGCGRGGSDDMFCDCQVAHSRVIVECVRKTHSL